MNSRGGMYLDDVDQGDIYAGSICSIMCLGTYRAALETSLP